MELYSFYNSSTSYRVRIALALKGVDYTLRPINIRAKQHRDRDYMARNPSANVPLLVDGDFELGQSLAIIDYLDSHYPQPRLIPPDDRQRARVLEIANLVACDIHPVNNLRVLRYLIGDVKATQGQKDAWYRHWIAEGLTALEGLLARSNSDRYCVNDTVSLADCCVVPQVANALRMSCDISAVPRTMAVYEHCTGLAAFRAAAPENQPDFTRG